MRRERRRKYAIAAAVMLFGLLPVMLLIGLVSDVLAARVVLLRPVILLAVAPSTAIIFAYLGIGLTENLTSMWKDK
jgi:hypothetical protein